MDRETPPSVLERLLSALLSGTDTESVPGDFAEIYHRLQKDNSPIRVWRWYIGQIVCLLPSYIYHQVLWSAAMLKNHLMIGMRLLRRHIGYSAINIAGLAIGMACFLMIAMWVREEISYDRWHEHAEHTYWVIYKKPGASEFSTYGCGAIGLGLQNRYPEITHFSRHFGPVSSPLRFKDKIFNADAVGIDPGFFDIFSLDFQQGSPSHALNYSNSIVLTESTAYTYFGNEDPIGKTMNFEWWGTWHDFQVTAVVGDLPGNTHLDFDYLLPIDFVTRSGMAIDTWDMVAYRNYVRLREDADPEAVNSKIAGIWREHVPDRELDVELFPASNIHLFYSPIGAKTVTYVALFSMIGFLILFMACINFVNLATARAARRALEVGMRKVIGANRSQLVRQFLAESILMTLIALICSLALVWLLLPGVNAISGKSLALHLDSTLALQILAVTTLVGIGAGLYPAFYLSRFRPALVMGRSSTSRGGNPLFRKILVVVQFSVSILLIIASIVVLRQSNFMRSHDWGIHTEYVVNMELRGGIRRNYYAIREEMLRLPHVEQICITNGSLNKRFSTDSADWEGRQPGQKLSMAIHAVDYEYDDVFGIEMVQGRFFSRDFSTDAEEAIVLNQTAVRLMGMEDPVGKRFDCSLPYDPDRMGRIVGVVKDFHFRSLHEPISPLILVIAPGWITDLYIRLDGVDVPGTMAAIEKLIKTHAPDSPFDYRFLDKEIDDLYRSEVRMGGLVKGGTGLAVLIACMGLFGLASFMAEQRTKEIGIRKVLGSSTAGIMTLLSKDFLLWVGIANLIAWPIAWWAMSGWLHNFAYRAPLTIWPFVLSGVAALMIAWLTISWQSLRAATSDPVKALRYE